MPAERHIDFTVFRLSSQQAGNRLWRNWQTQYSSHNLAVHTGEIGWTARGGNAARCGDWTFEQHGCATQIL